MPYKRKSKHSHSVILHAKAVQTGLWICGKGQKEETSPDLDERTRDSYRALQRERDLLDGKKLSRKFR